MKTQNNTISKTARRVMGIGMAMLMGLGASAQTSYDANGASLPIYGGGNVALGYTAMYTNATTAASGDRNVALGFRSLYMNTTGGGNTATGYESMYWTSTGFNNTAYGYQSLVNNTTGNWNVGCGYRTLFANSTGGFNTACGYSALLYNTTGTHNTAVGNFALNSNTTASYNTTVGDYADVGNGLTNSTSIGAGTYAGQSNAVVLGNGAVTGTYCAGPYFNLSDGRFKKKVAEDVKGLDFIKKLRPVTYNFESKAYEEFLTKDMPDSVRQQYLSQDFSQSGANRQSGFIAQEVEKAAQEAGYDFNGIHKPANDKDNYSLSYATFVVPLVKAVQEQQKMIEDQKAVIEKLQQQMAEIKAVSGSNTTATTSTVVLSNNTVVLNQNAPNPFAENTVISYNIPENCNSAQLIFTNLEGKQIKTQDITTKGAGKINVYGGDLSTGMYTYTLMVDGKVIDTKKMNKQ